jgi:GNAT superfamily N-acetyltransferase
MSFWKESPGPTWRHCIESFNPCVRPEFGLCKDNLLGKLRTTSLSKAFRIVPLTAKHASDMEPFLKEHFTLYPRCQIALTRQRIQQGFDRDGWIGVGIYLIDKTMIGCCVSKPLGRMKFTHETLEQGGLVEYFCVHKNYRKNGIASYMLDELVLQTAKKERSVHCFMKEGFPLLSLPPLYTSHYIVRRRRIPGEEKESLSPSGIALHSLIRSYSHAEYLPLNKFVANLPSTLSGDSELFVFNLKGHTVFLCMTESHHKTSPEGHTVGELSWFLPQTIEVPLSIQRLAIEACVDCGKFDIVLMDGRFPHDRQKGWRKDATFSWYLYNYNPGEFFSVKPFWIQ